MYLELEGTVLLASTEVLSICRTRFANEPEGCRLGVPLEFTKYDI